MVAGLMTALDKTTHLSRLFRDTNKRDEKASSKARYLWIHASMLMSYFKDNTMYQMENELYTIKPFR